MTKIDQKSALPTAEETERSFYWNLWKNALRKLETPVLRSLCLATYAIEAKVPFNQLTPEDNAWVRQMEKTKPISPEEEQRFYASVLATLLFRHSHRQP